jgi:hypothetical protein
MAEDALEQEGGGIEESGGTGGEAAPEEMGDFFRSLPDDMKADPTLQNLRKADNATIGKTLVNQQSMIGKKGVILPNMGDADDVKRFYGDLGMPESAEGYKDALKGTDWSKNNEYDASEMAEIALEGGLSPDQASRTEQAFLKRQEAHSVRMEQEAETLKGENDQKLRVELGDKFEERSALGDAVINKFARTPEAAAALRALADSDPMVKASLMDIGGKFSEHSLPDFQPKRFESSPQEAREKANAMREDMKGPYWSDDRAVQEKAQEDVLRWEDQANKGGA